MSKAQYEIEIDESVARMGNEELLDSAFNSAQGDDWDGMFTKRGKYEAVQTRKELERRLIKIGFLKLTTTILLILFAGIGYGQTYKKDSAYWVHEMDSFNKRRADTANYWLKPIGDDISMLVSARDTVKCYFEYVIDNIENGPIYTAWYLGYARRYHEQVTGFFYNKECCPVKTSQILNYKIKQ